MLAAKSGIRSMNGIAISPAAQYQRLFDAELRHLLRQTTGRRHRSVGMLGILSGDRSAFMVGGRASVLAMNVRTTEELKCGIGV